MGGERASALDRVWRLASTGGQPEVRFVCLTCRATHDVQYHVCPDCGGFSVERDATADED